MRCRHWMLLLVFLVVGILGCGGSDPENGTPGANDAESGPGGAAAESEPGDAADTSQPAAAVSVFLEALRKGNDKKVLQMYTARARQQAAELNRPFAPKGSDTAQFEVGAVEYLADDGARVRSRWTDLDRNRQPLTDEILWHTDEILWMVRREPEGWRIAGMAATVFEGEPPLLLDFENLSETLRKIRALKEEIDRRTENETSAAQRPEISTDSFRR